MKTAITPGSIRPGINPVGFLQRLVAPAAQPFRYVNISEIKIET
jgi:hypothetical protein